MNNACSLEKTAASPYIKDVLIKPSYIKDVLIKLYRMTYICPIEWPIEITFCNDEIALIMCAKLFEINFRTIWDI